MGALTGKGEVITELERVFGHPGSNAYSKAQRKKDNFEKIKDQAGNWQDLVDAYKAAGVKDDQHWKDDYLQKLSSKNIYTISQARFDGLTAGVAMITQTHPPADGGDVIVSHQANGTIIIDSPYPNP